jgi:steroid delta-isomerase-like uncharacterized protein
MMDRADVLEWVGRYEGAWRDGSEADLAALFTEDVEYLVSPYAEPFRGLDALRPEWVDDAPFSMTVESVVADEVDAVVRVTVRYGTPRSQEYRDLWVLRFAADGRVARFEEWAYYAGLLHFSPVRMEALLVEHADAWNDHDLDRLMGLFADDCVFEASGGPDACGERIVGRDAVRSAFAAVLASMPDAHWGDGRHHRIDGEHGVSEWHLTGTRADGTRVDVRGCDFLTVRDGLIVEKASFRKQRTE